MAGHLQVGEAFAAVTDGARTAMGLPVVTIAPGYPAELLAVPGDGLADAIARAGDERIVWHHGRIVARTTVQTTVG